MHRRWQRCIAGALLIGAAMGAPLHAWLISGHRRVTAAAVAQLSKDLPAVLRDGDVEIAAGAAEPDLWKRRATPTLADGEMPAHYLDWERLGDAKLPPVRSEYEDLLLRLGLTVREVGYLPYAVLEGEERLALCLAEWRARPDDPGVDARCRLYAGWLAHYAEDLEQPLHTTMHHDGWALPGGGSPATGIHYLVDSLFAPQTAEAEIALADLPAPTAYPDLAAAIREEMAASHRLVDLVYVMEPAIRAGGDAPDPRVAAFACERFRATVLFVARLFTTAWERSATLEVPGYWRE